ncbi:MAG TPA: heme biosynthesis HemY N-terminal domain-containing protein, partial [Gammaproteobacteria bacterium]
MKLLLGLLLVLFAATAAALVLLRDSGYVLIGYGAWTVEMSLAVLVALVLAAAFTLHFALRLAGGTVQLPRRLRLWRARRRERRASRGLTRGLLALAEGDWGQAEKRLLQQAGSSETPLLHYLAAARAAHAQSAHERRDHYLKLAHQALPEADLAVGLTQAELQLEHQQLEQAESTLLALQRRAPHHRQLLKLLMRLYLQTHDWQRLRLLLPELRRRKALPGNEYTVLELKVFGELLDEAAAAGEPGELGRVWSQVPDDLRSGELLVLTYARHLVRFERGSEAEPLLRGALDRHLSDRLVELYGLVDGGQANRQLEHAERWLASDPRNPVLLLTVGRLAARAKLWGKARGALESSVAAQPRAETCRELGLLHEQLG